MGFGPLSLTYSPSQLGFQRDIEVEGEHQTPLRAYPLVPSPSFPFCLTAGHDQNAVECGKRR